MHKNILIDFEKIKDPYSGLGQFCQHLKVFFDKSNLPIKYFIPNKKQKLAKHFSFLLPKCDIFHAVHQDSPFVPFWSKTKYILTIHDLNSLSENPDPDFQKHYRKTLQKKIDRASIVTFISNFTQKETESIFDLTKKRTFVIYNGISLPEISEAPIVLPKAKYIFSIGTVVPKKNFHVLIEMMKHLPDYQLIIAGTLFHQYAKELQTNIKDQNLGERIHLVGTVPDTVKRWYYENACAFVFPSLLEGFGLPVAEAMSLGLPLFLSHKTSLPEIGGSDANYFSSFDGETMASEFIRGMKNFDETKKISLIKRSKMFDWKNAADSYLELYHL
jgi:glycosyltransferase involved in cell wall biosynthesis